MSFQSRYTQLNTEQKEAVDTINGPVMVVAGPGSGKTELLSLRVANILHQTDAEPQHMLCLTFTDAAAKNMKARLSGLIGMAAHRVAVHTFHTFAQSIRYRYADEFSSWSVRAIDEITKKDILGSILQTYPLHHPFSKKDPHGQYVYLRAIDNRIDSLKKAAITPKQFQSFLTAQAKAYEIIARILLPILSEKISKQTASQLEIALAELRAHDSHIDAGIPHLTIPSYLSLCISQLEQAIEESQKIHPTKPITAFKNHWFSRDPSTKTLALKDAVQLERNVGVAEVYAAYQVALQERELIDFHDMIMDVIEQLEQKPGMLADLQEQFHYIMVDEFQDTNDAQMRLLQLLLDNPAHEGKPNILVVGDDDQAIYKFQGAEINNILQFHTLYDETAVITLQKNYRSTADIVSFAQAVINQGQERLSTMLEEVDKSLEAANPSIAKGTIEVHGYATSTEEMQGIIDQIVATKEQGIAGKDIAVIARNHRQLQQLVPLLQGEQIAYAYQKQRNILDEELIQALLQLMQLVFDLSTNQQQYSKELLPEVLQAPYWGLSREQVWQIAVAAKAKTNSSWIQAMLASDDEQCVAIATWLLDVAARVPIASFDTLFDELVGNGTQDKFISPFRSYYFPGELRKEQPETYVSLLSAIQTLLDTIRAYGKAMQSVTLETALECIVRYQTYALPIIDTSPYVSGEDAVELLTAHGAKGLEFDTVFVLHCQQDVWMKGQRAENIVFPRNMRIEPAEETDDDFLRLFYVAMTRAKRQLQLSFHRRTNTGKANTSLAFVDVASQDHDQVITHTHGSDTAINARALEQQIFVPAPLTQTEQAVLSPLIERYSMSVTHLNNFLDVTKGGPQYFLEKNLLRFPQGKSISMMYGTAIHATVEQLYRHLRDTGAVANEEQTMAYLEEALAREPLSADEYKKLKEKGKRAMSAYLRVHGPRMQAEDRIEVNFAQQGVVVEDISITGKIDRLHLDEESKTISVFDIKTGKPKKDWKGRSEIEKIQLHNYKRQLVFYKILVESARDYQAYRVDDGALVFVTDLIKDTPLLLTHTITQEDVDTCRALIQGVGKCIKQTVFPDVSAYDPTLAGIKQFEIDIINNKYIDV